MATYDVHGIRLAVSSNWPRFDDLVRLNLGYFASDAHEDPPLTVHIELRKKPWLSPGASTALPPTTAQTWGTGLSLDGTKVSYEKRHLNLEYEEAPASRVRATYELDRKSRIRGLLRELPPWEDCQFVLRLALYDPVFHQLERRGFRLLHSAAVADDRGALLLMGLNGSGKSSLCYTLLRRFRYMSDNFLLMKGPHVYAFPETLRLPLSTDPSFSELPYPMVFGKRLVPVEASKTQREAPPRQLVFITRGPKTTIEKLSRTEALRRIRMIADMTHEFPPYGFLGLLSDYLDSSAEELAGAVDSFVLAMSDLREASDLLSDLWAR